MGSLRNLKESETVKSGEAHSPSQTFWGGALGGTVELRLIPYWSDRKRHHHNMGVSKNRGTPKSSILIGFSIINHPFWGFPPIFGNIHIMKHWCTHQIIRLSTVQHWQASPRWPSAIALWRQSAPLRWPKWQVRHGATGVSPTKGWLLRLCPCPFYSCAIHVQVSTASLLLMMGYIIFDHTCTCICLNPTVLISVNWLFWSGGLLCLLLSTYVTRRGSHHIRDLHTFKRLLWAI